MPTNGSFLIWAGSGRLAILLRMSHFCTMNAEFGCRHWIAIAQLAVERD